MVVLPIAEAVEMAVPDCTAEEHNVLLVHLTDGSNGTLLERFESALETCEVMLEIVSDGFVHQFVAEDDLLVLIAAGNHLPDIAELLLCHFAFEEPGIAEGVVDVIAGLTAGAVVHIEDEVEMELAAPFNDLIHAGKAFATLLITLTVGSLTEWVGITHVVLAGKEFVVEGKADGVSSR